MGSNPRYPAHQTHALTDFVTGIYWYILEDPRRGVVITTNPRAAHSISISVCRIIPEEFQRERFNTNPKAAHYWQNPKGEVVTTNPRAGYRMLNYMGRTSEGKYLPQTLEQVC